MIKLRAQCSIYVSWHKISTFDILCLIIFASCYHSNIYVACACLAELLIGLSLLKDGALFQRALAFYRLMVVWLVDRVGGFKMPLPSKCPMEFACMPEHFVEDVMDLLLFAYRIPQALDGIFLVSC